MTGSAPSDLAVTFRSLARRRAEVEASAGGDAAALAAARPSLDAMALALGKAADLLGVASHGSVREIGEAAAAAVARVPPEQWEAGPLADLQALALTCGRHLREAQDAVDRTLGR